jgi:hypothetical protein
MAWQTLVMGLSAMVMMMAMMNPKHGPVRCLRGSQQTRKCWVDYQSIKRKRKRKKR